MRWTKEDFWICDDPNGISAQSVVRLHREVYGIDAYPLETVQQLLNTSLWLGLYNGVEIIGFARAITDKHTLCFLCDIIVDPRFRRQGLGSWMMQCFLEHPDVQGLPIGLGTNDGDGFFEKHDFYRDTTMRRLPSSPPKTRSGVDTAGC